MAAFTFADFLVFSGASNVNEDAYVTIAKGVLNHIKKQYGIYPETETIIETMFLSRGQRSVTPNVYPIVSVYRLWNDSDLIDDDTYSYYGEDILMDIALVDVRIPLLVELDMGFEGNIPDDLILAVYRHIISVYQAIDKHTDNISKAINADGNTAYFVSDVIPLASKQTYQFYAGHTLLSN